MYRIKENKRTVHQIDCIELNSTMKKKRIIFLIKTGEMIIRSKSKRMIKRKNKIIYEEEYHDRNRVEKK